MQDNGYVVDIGYPEYFHPQMSPVSLNFACGFSGVRSGPFTGAFSYLELGAGPGTTAAILAAANPRGHFYCADFNPDHVVAANRLKGEAGLTNLTVLEAGFAGLAAGSVELPACDIVAMSGVYSWVNREQRAHILTVLDRYVKPGGIVYVNYNAMPGWSAASALQRLVLEVSDASAGDRGSRLTSTRQWLQQFAACDPRFLADTTTLAFRLDSIQTSEDGYVAHEFMDRGWEALYHWDVAESFAAAGLEFAATTDFPRIQVDLLRTPAQRSLLDGVAPRMRETMKDFLDNASLRHDVFVRGARRMSRPDFAQWLDRAGLGLVPDRSRERAEDASDPRAAALLRLLADRGPLTFAELRQGIAEAGEIRFGELLGFACGIIADGGAVPYLRPATPPDREPARRLNTVIARRACGGGAAFAAPAVGSGIRLGLLDTVVLSALLKGGDARAGSLAEQARAGAVEHNLDITVEGRVRRAADVTHREMVALVEAVRRDHAPVWERLGLLETAVVDDAA